MSITVDRLIGTRTEMGVWPVGPKILEPCVQAGATEGRLLKLCSRIRSEGAQGTHSTKHSDGIVKTEILRVS